MKAEMGRCNKDRRQIKKWVVLTSPCQCRKVCSIETMPCKAGSSHSGLPGQGRNTTHLVGNIKPRREWKVVHIANYTLRALTPITWPRECSHAASHGQLVAKCSQVISVSPLSDGSIRLLFWRGRKAKEKIVCNCHFALVFTPFFGEDVGNDFALCL